MFRAYCKACGHYEFDSEERGVIEEVLLLDCPCCGQNAWATKTL